MSTDEWTSYRIRDLLVDETTGYWGTAPLGSGELSVIRSTNLARGERLNFDRVARRSFPDRKINQKRLEPGDILLERSGGGPNRPVGRVAYFQTEGLYSCSNFMQRLRPNRRLVSGRFLTYALSYLHSSGVTLLMQQATTGIRNLNYREYLAYRLHIPSPPIQRKIASILASIDDSIEKTQAVIDQVQIAKRGLLQELLTRGLPGRHKRFNQTEIGEVPEAWDVVSLAQSGATVTSGSRGWAKYYSDDGALFLRITNVARNTIRLRLGDVRYVALPKGSTEGKRTRVQTGDLVISITADLGMVGFIPDGIGEAYVNQHLALVRLPDDALRPEFVGYFLATDIARNRFYRLNDASAKAGLNLPAIMKLTVPKPPRDEQDMTVEVLTATEDRLAVEEKKLVGLAAVKSALMSVLLTGELRVTPDPEPA